jgi:predicted RNase H-like nuclease
VVVAGADGCPKGWVICYRTANGELLVNVVETLEKAFDLVEGLSILAVDMPIGLLDVPQRGGRECERQAKEKLGAKRSSVFASPCRPALAASTHAEANRISKALGIGISIQAFGLFKKLKEIDDLVRDKPAIGARIREVHPELAFARMNNCQPVMSKKRKAEGRAERCRLLSELVLMPNTLKLKGANTDDILDAVACYRTAGLIAAGTATRLGGEEEKDRHGLPMNIWF